MNHNINDKHNRRDFLISSARKAVVGSLGFVGITLGYKSLNSDPGQECEVNLPCRNCFKLGSCVEDKAVEKRNEIKLNDQPTKIMNGKNNG